VNAKRFDSLLVGHAVAVVTDDHGLHAAKRALDNVDSDLVCLGVKSIPNQFCDRVNGRGPVR
jgi:hypothetical protein